MGVYGFLPGGAQAGGVQPGVLVTVVGTRDLKPGDLSVFGMRRGLKSHQPLLAPSEEGQPMWPQSVEG